MIKNVFKGKQNHPKTAFLGGLFCFSPFNSNTSNLSLLQLPLSVCLCACVHTISTSTDILHSCLYLFTVQSHPALQC